MQESRESIQLIIDGKEMSFPEGITYREVAQSVQADYDYRILLALENNRLRELRSIPVDGKKVHFLTIRDGAGSRAYQRSLSLMLQTAVYDLYGRKSGYDLFVHFTVSDGLYYTLNNPENVTDEFLQAVLDQMRKLQERALPIEKRNIPTTQARKLFESWNMHDKEQLFRYRLSSRTNIYEVDGVPDYSYGYMVPDTSYLETFNLVKYQDGFVLQFPRQTGPDELPAFEPEEKLFSEQHEALEWGKRIGINTVASLNRAIVTGRAKELLLTQEAYHESRLARIAEQIAGDPRIKLVMIAGPSSSGKTTFSHRLSAQLSVYGLKPHPIPMDDYFVNREDTPKDEDGNYDFECLEAIDVKQFSEDMLRLLAGEEVELPTFNFRIGKREYKGNKKQLGTKDVLVIEGIHALNPKLTQALPEECRFRIYISPMTQLNIDEHNRIPTTDGRLLRRIVRDARTRGTSAAGTIAMWPSVRRGEENHIYPHRHRADVMFNSALIYELAVLKTYAEPLLFGIDEDAPEYSEAKRLLKFLDYFVPMPADQIPQSSLIREFIGGSCFDV